MGTEAVESTAVNALEKRVYKVEKEIPATRQEIGQKLDSIIGTQSEMLASLATYKANEQNLKDRVDKIDKTVYDLAISTDKKFNKIELKNETWHKEIADQNRGIEKAVSRNTLITGACACVAVIVLVAAVNQYMSTVGHNHEKAHNPTTDNEVTAPSVARTNIIPYRPIN